ncbi:MAG: hypothetical protein VB064_02655 [Oscillospiraceae bacterium]|nr:hypothetical protein [Oscillospiraceae bacterium]
MLGLTDVSICLAYLLSVGSAIFCVVYGVLNWNRDGSDEKEEDKK